MNNITKKIWLVVWQGRDSDSGVWGAYPCTQFGFFTNRDDAVKYADKLNRQYGERWDEDAQAYYHYYADYILEHDPTL